MGGTDSRFTRHLEWSDAMSRQSQEQKQAAKWLSSAHPENFQAPLSGGSFSLLLPDGSPNPASPTPERAQEVSRARERRNARRAARVTES